MFNTIYRFIYSRTTLFSTYAIRLAADCKAKGYYSRAANYLTAIRSFTKAVGELSLNKIDKTVLARYQEWMRRQGICDNTASCYNRLLRAIYNKAVGEGLVSDHHPFGACFMGKMKTEKRSIDEHSIIRLKAADLSQHEELIPTRDFFLFSFYTMGMPFVDIAYLRKSQIKDNLLVYRRHKTHQMVKVPLCEDAIHIINIYSAQTHDYVFPLLSSLNEAKAYGEYCTRLNAYNRSLKRLAKVTGINIALTSYTMRHSCAASPTSQTYRSPSYHKPWVIRGPTPPWFTFALLTISKCRKATTRYRVSLKASDKGKRLFFNLIDSLLFRHLIDASLLTASERLGYEVARGDAFRIPQPRRG